MPIDPSVLLKQEPMNIGNAIQAGAQGNLAITRADQARTEFADQQNDAPIVKDYSALPGTDLYTTKGLAAAMDHMRGRISAKSFMELGDRFTKAQANELAYKSHALSYSKAMLEAEHDDNEFVVRNLSGYFNATEDQKPQVLSDALSRMEIATKPDGTPRLTPKQIGSLRQAPSSALDAMYTTSDFKKSVNKDLLDQATIKEKTARAEQLSGIGPTDQYTSPDGKSYVKAKKSGQVYLVGADDSYTPAPYLPPGSINVNTPPKVNAFKQKIDDQKAYTADLLANPTMDVLAAGVDLAINPSATVGLGPNDPSRPAMVSLGKMLKMSPEGMAAASDYKAKTGALIAFERMKAITSANEVTAENLLAQVQPLLEKGVTSPTDIKFINNWLTSYKRAIGDVDVAKVDLFEKALKADVARIQSGSTSAVSTPVAFLKNGEVILPMGMKTTDYADIIKAIKQDMGARISANEATVKELKDSLSQSRLLLAKKAGEAAKLAKSTNPDDWDKFINGEPTSAATPAAAPAPAEEPIQTKYTVEQLGQELKDARAAARGGDKVAATLVPKLEARLKAAGGIASADGPKENDEQKSKSGKPMVFRNGQWEYK